MPTSLLCLTALVGLAACTSAPSRTWDAAEPLDVPTIPGTTSEALAEARARWDAADIDAYTLVVRRSCFCPPEALGPFEVEVRDGQVTSVHVGGRAVENELAITVETLFSALHQAYEADAVLANAEYHTQNGLPVTVGIDISREIMDEETSSTVLAFEPR